MLVAIIKTLFSVYTLMLLANVLGMWFPNMAHHPIMRAIRVYTDPYLNIFRKIIPPLGGMIDLSPIIAFLCLQLLEALLLKLL